MPRPSSYMKGKSTVNNPRDLDVGMTADRMNPPRRPTGGPAYRQGGARMGDAPNPTQARFNPAMMQVGGPALNAGGHRLGMIHEVNPAHRYHPKTKA